MSQAAEAPTRPATELIRQVAVTQTPNGMCFAAAGEVSVPSTELERMVGAVPRGIAALLDRKAYYFVPLVISEGDQTLVAEQFSSELVDAAVCHRNVPLGDSQGVFISTRLMDDRFSVAFEFFINVAHPFVERSGFSEKFADLVWEQAKANVRGESSLDAFELRRLATAETGDTEKSRNEYLSATFADAIAVYMLSLYLDVDYYELRERDYPLLAPSALAERLRTVNQLFPANPGYQFEVLYRRRS
jgi:hypothetical protein